MSTSPRLTKPLRTSKRTTRLLSQLYRFGLSLCLISALTQWRAPLATTLSAQQGMSILIRDIQPKGGPGIVPSQVEREIPVTANVPGTYTLIKDDIDKAATQWKQTKEAGLEKLLSASRPGLEKEIPLDEQHALRLQRAHLESEDPHTKGLLTQYLGLLMSRVGTLQPGETPRIIDQPIFALSEFSFIDSNRIVTFPVRTKSARGNASNYVQIDEYQNQRLTFSLRVPVRPNLESLSVTMRPPVKLADLGGGKLFVAGRGILKHDLKTVTEVEITGVSQDEMTSLLKTLAPQEYPANKAVDDYLRRVLPVVQKVNRLIEQY